MATATQIDLHEVEHLYPHRHGVNPESTPKTKKLLEQNHEQHHIVYNNRGFHNHIAHHLLSIWALGGTEKDVQKGYDVNASYQIPLKAAEQSAVIKLHDEDNITSYFGKKNNYPVLLKHFTDVMQRKGSSWQDVVNQYLFSGSDTAEALLSRMYTGILHPIIHLGFGIEFQQPMIVAESLAQAAIHRDEFRQLLLPAEIAAKKLQEEGATSKTFVQLLDAIHADKKLLNCVRWEDNDHMSDGVFGRAGDRIVELTSQYFVRPDELALKTAEMINAVSYYTAGAQRSDRAIKYDFLLIHSVNSSIFWSSFLKQEWISDKDKVRLLEWKVRTDLALYVSYKSPPTRLEEIRNYRPKHPSGWDEIRRRVIPIADDGHAAKLVRALEHGQHVCGPYEDREEFRIKHKDWLQMGHMAIDSVEDESGPQWVHSAGFDEAWSGVPLRASL